MRYSALIGCLALPVLLSAVSQADEPGSNKNPLSFGVQTGTGNRIEFWNSHGTPLSSNGKIRRYIDIGRLNKGR